MVTIHEIAALETVLATEDWFLRHEIESRRDALRWRVSRRIVGERDRFLQWKRAWLKSDAGLDGREVLDLIVRHSIRVG
jgi:hypothetical protein